MGVIAYRFDGVDDRVEFAIAPLSGYTFGAGTLACLFKRTTAGTDDFVIWITDSNGSTNRLGLFIDSGNGVLVFLNGSQTVSLSCASTTAWYLLACSWSSATGTYRGHLWNGTSWTHATSTGALGGSFTVAGTSRLAVGARPDGAIPFVGDIVCAGIKKSDSSDATVETLSPTSFQSWRDFGFDWLIGFDSSLESAGIVQDQGAAGTGDEIGITGTTAVSDPPSWAWVVSTPPVANFTATPTSGTATLAVTFTDTSTNTPTSWAWDFGDGGTSTSQNPSHSYTSSGVYTVTLTATNAAGSDGETKTGYITVSEAITYVQPYWIAGGTIDIW